jgi:hypothetical protein
MKTHALAVTASLALAAPAGVPIELFLKSRRWNIGTGYVARAKPSASHVAPFSRSGDET